MSPTQSRNSNLVDNANGQDPVYGSSSPPYLGDSAVSNVADPMESPSGHECVFLRDPFAYYKAFLNASVPSGSGTSDIWQLDSGYTCPSGPIGAQPTNVGEQHSAETRPAICNLAVRLANRSNGAPLATIVEQDSYYTLNSHGSLVGRYPSIRIVENVSPTSSPQRTLQGADEKPLEDIREDCPHDRDVRASDGVDLRLDEDRREVDLLYETASPIKSISREHPLPSASQLSVIEYNLESKGLKGFFGSVLQNVRAGSQSRSRAASLTNAPIIDTRGERISVRRISPQTQSQGVKRHLSVMEQAKQHTFCNPSPNDKLLYNCLAHPPYDPPETQVLDQTNLGVPTKSKSSAPAFMPIPHLPPHRFQKDTALGAVPHLLPPSCQRSRERKGSSSVRSVRHQTRDAAQDHTKSEALMICQASRDHISARYTSDGVPVCRQNAPSLRDSDRARDASRNTSLCSTMSTSYSGTVLGVDLDLQCNFPSVSRRPTSPAWCTPQVTAVQNADSPTSTLSESRHAKSSPAKTGTTTTSITSAALPALLPVAAASGIVRPNATAPRPSFFSPSGNLIQVEDTSASSLGTVCSSYGGSPTTVTSYYNDNNTISAHASLAVSKAGLPPARPATVPLSTAPTSVAPLPAHLRHHHNYRHAESAHFVPSEGLTFASSGLAVKGCGGVIRNNSLNPRSGVRRSPIKTKTRVKHRRQRSESEISQPRYTLLPPRGPPRKGKTLQKRHKQATVKIRSASSPRLESVKGGDNVGLLTGQALRLCFCQPYDGARTHSANMLCTHTKTDDKRPDQQCANADGDAYARETREIETPNARVVEGNKRGLQRADTQKRKRKDGGDGAQANG